MEETNEKVTIKEIEIKIEETNETVTTNEIEQKIDVMYRAIQNHYIDFVNQVMAVQNTIINAMVEFSHFGIEMEKKGKYLFDHVRELSQTVVDIILNCDQCSHTSQTVYFSEHKDLTCEQHQKIFTTLMSIINYDRLIAESMEATGGYQSSVIAKLQNFMQKIIKKTE